MKRLACLTAASALLASGSLHASESSASPDLDEARAIVKQFATQLQGELATAIKEGGPVKAIGVCKERAPAIASELGASRGWEVKRTSLKVRNTELNAPDGWERRVLNDFAQRQAAGAEVQTLVQSAVVETNGVKRFRFMQAIPTGEVCLACHGTAIAPEITTALDAQYPDDQARGFSLGEIRGAFSLSKPL